MKVDGIELGDGDALHAALREVLTTNNRADPVGIKWLATRYPSLDEANKRALGAAIRRCLADSNVAVCHGAIVVHQLQPQIDDSGELVRAAQQGADQLAQTLVSMHGHDNTDLLAEILRAIGSKVAAGLESGEVLRPFVVQPGRGMHALPFLILRDPLWVLDHAQEIARATPITVTTLLVGFRVHQRDPTEFLSAMRGLVAPEILGEAIASSRRSHPDDPL
jgi:hypothetical protein